MNWLIHLIVIGLGFNDSLSAQTQPPKEVGTETTAIVDRIIVQNTLTRSREVIEISAEIAGAIKLLNVSEGSRIEVGKELGRIKDDRASLAVQKAKLEWELADRKQTSDIAVRLTDKAALVASTEYDRAVRANKEIANTYAASEVDRRKLVFEKAQLEIEQAAYERSLAAGEAAVAKNVLDQAELELKRHFISSPVNGVVVAVKRQLGEWVEPGTPILEVVDMDYFRVEGFVSVAQAAQGLADRETEIEINLGSEIWKTKGKVVFVSPEANPVTLEVRVIIEVPFAKEKERLSFRSGLKCTAAIASNKEADVPAESDLKKE